MTEPNARVLADSLSPEGHRLTTLEVVMHRFVLAEMNTHRMFSRNSASSRAIPFAKQVMRVTHDIAVPVIWASEKPGMQGGAEVDEPATATMIWEHARNAAVANAKLLADIGVHKSICNRLLEPFMMHTAIISATDWDGFWMQRCSPLAQPEIRAAAEAMREAYETSVPLELAHGQWHLPLIDDDDYDDIDLWLSQNSMPEWLFNDATVVGAHDAIAKCCSVARVARVSRENHDTDTVDIDKDLVTYERLVNPGDGPPHASPLEHVATPCDWNDHLADGTAHLGNFTGWDQMRHQVLDF